MSDMYESADEEWEALYRWCVYCKADCWVDEPEHSAGCPSSTGVYEVRYERCHPPCEHCGKRPDPAIRCSECECLLALGDKYTHRQLDDIAGVPVYEPICLGCAAREALVD